MRRSSVGEEGEGSRIDTEEVEEDSWADVLGLRFGFGKNDLGLERVQAYSDAVLSIIATVLVVPLMKISEDSKKEILITGGSLFGVLTSSFRIQSLVTKWIGFWIVFLVFIWHGRGFRGLESGNTALVSANWIELLATSLLPFTSATAANADSASDHNAETRAPMIRRLYINVCLIGLAHLVFQFIANYSRSTWYSRLYLKEALMVFLVALAAFGLSFWAVHLASLVFVFLLPVIIGWSRWQFSREEVKQINVERLERLQERERLDREEPLMSSGSMSPGVAEKDRRGFDLHFRGRLEAFTDGVLAISATLIVLDIQPITSCKDLHTLEDCVLHWSEGCRPNWDLECTFDDSESLERSSWLMLAYVSSFICINVLWSLHHKLFNKIIPVTQVSDLWTQVLNGHFCFCVSLLPVSFGLLTDYAIQPVTKHKVDPFRPRKDISPDEEAASTACVLLCMILFFASSCLLALLLHHKWRSQKQVTPKEAVRYGIIPLFSLCCVIAFGSGRNRAFLYPSFLIPIAVLVVRLIYGQLFF